MNATSHPKRTPRALPTASAFCCLFALLAGGTGAWAGEASSVADDVAKVQPFIGQTTALVVKVDPARLALPDLSDALKSVPEIQEAFRRRTREAAQALEVFRAATGGQAVYATVGIPVSNSEQLVFLLLKETPDAKRKLLQEMASCVRDGLIVAMPDRRADVAAALDALVPSPRKGLADALEAVSDYPIQVLLLPPDYVRRTVTELLPRLPRQLGGGPSGVLTEGLVWAALGVDPAQVRVELVVQSASEEAARALAEHLPKMLQSAYDTIPDLQKRIPRKTFEALAPSIAPQVDGDRIAVRLAGLESTGGRLPLVTIAAAAIRESLRGAGAKRFKQILLAIHCYHDTHRMFPPRDADRDESGKSKLSWRVHLLPYLEEKLYQEFHLDEPWDSPHNKKLIEKMPNIYKSGKLVGIEPGHTTFLAPVGEDTVFGAQKATKIQDIHDGTSLTVVLVEVKPQRAVPWTAPQDYAFDPKAPGRGLEVGADGRFLAAFADGSVRPLRGNLEPELLLRLFRKSDGQRVDPKAIR